VPWDLRHALLAAKAVGAIRHILMGPLSIECCSIVSLSQLHRRCHVLAAAALNISKVLNYADPPLERSLLRDVQSVRCG